MENPEKPYPNDYLDENGDFRTGNPGGGRPKDTPETRLIKKATREIISEYKQALAEALPMIQPIIIAKALEGDISAIKEIHDRTMDKAKQPTDITSGGRPIPLFGNQEDVSNNNSNEENTPTI